MKFLLGVLVGAAGVVLVALAGDPRRKRVDSTSLDRQSRRFDDEMDGVQGADPRTLVTQRWSSVDGNTAEGEWKPSIVWRINATDFIKEN